MTEIPLLSQFDFHHRLAATPGAALVFFTAPTCAACKRLRRVLADARPDALLFEVDAARDQALTHEFDLLHLPAMFLYVNGCFHCEIAAREATTPERLHRMLALALEGPAGEAP